MNIIIMGLSIVRNKRREFHEAHMMMKLAKRTSPHDESADLDEGARESVAMECDREKRKAAVQYGRRRDALSTCPR